MVGPPVSVDSIPTVAPKHMATLWADARKRCQHPDLATALGNLALVNTAQGKLVQAESLNRRAQAIREQRTIPTD